MTSEGQIPLATAIRALRHELIEAVAEGEGESVRFALGTVELELQLEVSKEGSGDVGIKFWVISVGGKRTTSSASTHTVRLSLTPIRETAGGQESPVIVGSREASRPK